MISPQLLQQRLRQHAQLIAGAAELHGEARLEHVAQLGEEDALLVLAQRRERHRSARAEENPWGRSSWRASPAADHNYAQWTSCRLDLPRGRSSYRCSRAC